MFHTTHCEILGDLLPQNVTIQHTLHAEPVLSFILRTFEDRPDLDLPSGNSSNQSSSQGSIPATSSARTARSSSNSFNPRYQAQATSNSCYHDSCGFSSAPRFALWDQQSCSRALAQEQAQLQVLQASTPNYASGVENIAVARATEDDTDIATAQIAEEHELSSPRKYKISFRALDENEDSDIDDDNADSESSESSEIDADLAANCVSGGDSQLNAAALEANKKLQGSASYLIQYRRCVMLHLTVEQIQSYSQLLKTHRKYMLYVSGRLVPYYSVLDSGAHNVALSSGIKVPDRMQRQQGLSYTANNTFDYQRQNAEQELILVVDALYLIDPQLQHQPELLQETLMRHQVSAAISVPLLSQAQAQAHNNVVSANNAQASTASDYSAQVQAATAATAIPAAKAEACAQATATATATATADNAAYADNTTAIEDTTTREDAEVVTDLTSAQTVTAPAPQEQTQQLTLQAAYPLAQTTVSSILAVNLPEIPEELLRSHENCSQSGNIPLPHCSYTHYVRPAQSKSTNQRVRAHQEQVKATAPSISATHTAKPMVESTVPPANAAPSSQQQAQQLRNDELVASCVAPSLSIKVPQPNSTVLNKSTVINTAVDYARQISSRFTSPQASATPMKASEQPTQAQPRPTPQAQAQAQAQAQVNLQPQVPPQVQVQAQVQAQPLPAQGQPLPPQTQQGSFSAPQGMRSVTNNHAQMNNQSAQEVTPLPFPLGSSEPNNEPHAEPVVARQGVRTYRHTDCSAPTARYCTCAATGAGTTTAASAGASAATRAASGASSATGPSICATASTGSAACTGISAATGAGAGARAASGASTATGPSTYTTASTGISATTGAGASTGSAACTGICAATTARADASAATGYGNYTQGHYAARQAHAQTAPATLAYSQDRSTGNLANTGTNQYSHSGCNSSSGNGYTNSCGSAYIRDAFHANASKPRSKPVPVSNGSTQLSNVERILSQEQYAQQSYAAGCATLSHAQSATLDLRGQKTQILSSTLYTDRALGGNTASLARPCDLVSHNRDASRDSTNVGQVKTLDAIAPLEQELPLKKEIPLAPTTQHTNNTGAAATSSNNSANTAQKYLQSLRKHPAAALAIKAPLEGRSFTEFLHTWQTQGRLAAIGLKPIKLQLMVLGKDAKFKVNPRNIDSLAEAILASAVEANQGKEQPDLATQYRPLPKPFAPKQPLPQLLSNKVPKDKK